MEKAAFLGPKGENAAELECLLLEVLHDHVFWRRNFHPGDPRFVNEAEKRESAYAETAAQLRDELFQILAELKRGAPLYSPRQIGHMVSDATMPALVGYFAGLLYNQNNVVAEAAPETVNKERAYMAALARMIGYPPFLPETVTPEDHRLRTPYSWGHLSSGGTAANIEALWVARNVRLYPLSIKLLAHTHAEFAELGEIEVRTARGEGRMVGGLGTFDLFHLPVDEVTELHLRVREWLTEEGPDVRQELERSLPSVRAAGLAGLMQRYNERFPDDTFLPPVVYIAQTAHYGWAKAMDVVGLGRGGLRMIPVTSRLRLDADDLAGAIRDSAARGELVLMTIGILGTTEEGSIDPLHEIEDLKDDLAAEGITFWHHVDAAFGGYLTSAIPREEDGRALSFDEAGEDLLDEDVYRAAVAVARADSVTIDPHKWGYVPYPAGAVLYRDYHTRNAIAYAAPYLPGAETTGFGGFLGRWTLEGSRPGAPAVGAYLSQTVLPLDPSGHGRLVRRCITSARAVADALKARFESGPVRLVLLAEPDTVGFCFALIPEHGAETVEAANAFNRAVWEHVNVDGREDIGGYQFILSKTEMAVAPYRNVLEALLPEQIESAGAREAVFFLRVFVLNPFVGDWHKGDLSFAEALASFLGRLAEALDANHAGGVEADLMIE